MAPAVAEPPAQRMLEINCNYESDPLVRFVLARVLGCCGNDVLRMRADLVLVAAHLRGMAEARKVAGEIDLRASVLPIGNPRALSDAVRLFCERAKIWLLLSRPGGINLLCIVDSSDETRRIEHAFRDEIATELAGIDYSTLPLRLGWASVTALGAHIRHRAGKITHGMTCGDFVALQFESDATDSEQLPEHRTDVAGGEWMDVDELPVTGVHRCATTRARLGEVLAGCDDETLFILCLRGQAAAADGCRILPEAIAPGDAPFLPIAKMPICDTALSVFDARHLSAHAGMCKAATSYASSAQRHARCIAVGTPPPVATLEGAVAHVVNASTVLLDTLPDFCGLMTCSEASLNLPINVGKHELVLLRAPGCASTGALAATGCYGRALFSEAKAGAPTALPDFSNEESDTVLVADLSSDCGSSPLCVPARCTGDMLARTIAGEILAILGKFRPLLTIVFVPPAVFAAREFYKASVFEAGYRLVPCYIGGVHNLHSALYLISLKVDTARFIASLRAFVTK